MVNDVAQDLRFRQAKRVRGQNRSLMITINNVIIVIGAGSIGQAIARRVSAGKHVALLMAPDGAFITLPLTRRRVIAHALSDSLDTDV